MLRAGHSRLASIQEPIVGVFLFACAAITVLTTIGTAAALGVEARDSSLLALASTSSSAPSSTRLGHPRFGLPLLWGTFVIALGSSVIALPIGLLSAIYLSEYAHRRVRAVLKPALELLAGVPTIVYGYLALLLVTPTLKAILAPLGLRVETFNALSACIVVGVMVIPMVSSLSEDVLSAVRETSARRRYGLGATKFEAVRGSSCWRASGAAGRSSWRSAGPWGRRWPSCSRPGPGRRSRSTR